jgi:hypothetical protein
LAVEPGVQVLFSTNSNLWVHGILEVNGTENAPVVFSPAPGSSQWGAILLKNTSGVSNMKYLELEGASAGRHRL